MKYLLALISIFFLPMLGSPSAWSAPKSESGSTTLVAAKDAARQPVRRARHAARKPSTRTLEKKTAVIQDTPGQIAKASPPALMISPPLSTQSPPVPIVTKITIVTPPPLPVESAPLTATANPYLQSVVPTQVAPALPTPIAQPQKDPWTTVPPAPTGIGPTLNGIGILVTSLMPTLPTLPPQLTGFFPVSLLPGDPGASHLPISIKTVYPTGDKPLVVLTLKCPTEAAFGVAPPPVKLVHIILTAGMDGINATGLLPVNLQQVCQ